MKKLKIWEFFCLLSLMFFTSSHALAQQNEAKALGQSDSSDVSTQNQSQPSGTSTQNQSENEVRNQTNNPELGTMTQAELELRIEEQIEESKPTYSAENSESQSRTGAIAKASQNLIRLSYQIENQSEADQIRLIAKEQTANQDTINQALDITNNRTSIAKFFIGPNYGQFKSAKQLMEQNRLRIQELNRIMADISNQGAKTEFQNQILILEQQNTSLENQINDLISGFSLFGWLVRLVKGY